MIRREHPAPGIEVVFASEPEEVRKEISSGSVVFTDCDEPGAAGYAPSLEAFLDINDDYLIKIYDRFHGRGHVVDTVAAGDLSLTIRELIGSDLSQFLSLSVSGGSALCEDKSEFPGVLERYRRFTEGPVFIKSLMEACFDKSLHETFDTLDMGIWGVFSGDLMVGFVELMPGGEGVSMGYCVLDGYRGRGVGYASCSRMLRYAEEELGMEEIHIGCDSDNEASKALACKLGFKWDESSGKFIWKVRNKLK